MKYLQENLKNTIKNIYHIIGDDILVMENACKMIENACQIALPDLNKTIFNDENFMAEKIIQSCEQLPIMAKKRYILVKNILKANEKDIKRLQEYSQNPAEDSVLVLCEVPTLNIFGKIDAEKVDCKKLESFELAKIVENILKEYGKEIEKSAIDLLLEFCAKDLLKIKNELTKLAFFDNQKTITVEAVKKLVAKTDEFTVFEISTALTFGQGDKAINLLNKMLETMEFSVVLGLISSHFRRMLFSVLSDDTTANIANFLGVKEFAIIKAKQQAKNLKPLQLIKINELILEVDYKIKDGKMASENAMYFLVFGIVEIIKGKAE
ncbi:MAG: DNA polymerase III subunit delta [Clostridia bacterium]|nr:DNA polymerase III subunit delta [Clostridia bacterium]